MVPWGGPGSPQRPPNGTNYKDDQPLECLTHIWFHMRGLMGCRHCKMSDLFKNSYFLVHFCSLLGVPDCPRVLPCDPFFEIIRGLNTCYNCMLSWVGFRGFGCCNDWFWPPKNDFLTLCVKLTPFESPKYVKICHTQTKFSSRMSRPDNQQNKTPFCTISLVHRQFFPQKNSS